MARAERHVADLAEEAPAAVARQRGAVFRVEKAHGLAFAGVIREAGGDGFRIPTRGEKRAAQKGAALRTRGLAAMRERVEREGESAGGTRDEGRRNREHSGHADWVLLAERLHIHCGFAAHRAAETRRPKPAEQGAT